jgi:hypothetical protein
LAADTLYDVDLVSTWRELEEFHPRRPRPLAETETVPAVNQIEEHPNFPNDSVRGRRSRARHRHRSAVIKALTPTTSDPSTTLGL